METIIIKGSTVLIGTAEGVHCSDITGLYNKATSLLSDLYLQLRMFLVLLQASGVWDEGHLLGRRQLEENLM